MDVVNTLKINVHTRCGNCPELDAVIKKEEIIADNSVCYKVHTVVCGQKERCDRLFKFLENNVETEEE